MDARPIVKFQDSDTTVPGVRTFTFIGGITSVLPGAEVVINLGIPTTRIFYDNPSLHLGARILYALLPTAIRPRDMLPGEMTVSTDEVGNQLYFQVKYQDGTYKEAFVPLV